MPQTSTAIRQALCRTDMPRGQVTLLKYLYENNKRVSTEELANGIRGGDVHSCTSILGPFSQRINNTPEISGTPGYRALVDKNRDDGQTYFQMREETREAIEDIPRLQTEFEREMADLRSAPNPIIQRDEFEL